MIQKELMNIISQEEIADNIFELILEGNLVKQMDEPGHFLHVKVSPGDTPLLRRPISVCDINKDENQCTIIYRAGGEGTKILTKQKDTVDILGPMGGAGFPVDECQEGETAILIGGGIGVPPLYELSKQLVAKGRKVIHVLGFASKKDVFYEDKFRELGDTYVATVDGSYGFKGMVTDVINQKELEFDILYSCGPRVMLRALEENYSHKRGYVSLEERMACGIGACYACVVHLKSNPDGSEYRRVCADGPVFKMGEVVI